MSSSMVADRYARALFELASEVNQVAKAAEELRRVAQAYSASSELRAVLSDPLTEPSDGSNIIRSIGEKLGVSPLVQNTLRVLVERRRMNALPEIADRLLQLSDDQSGTVKATVASAQPLSDAQFSAIKQELERLTGRKVSVERQHDPSLLAGVVARVGDHVIDASLRGRFQELEQRLLDNPS